MDFQLDFLKCLIKLLQNKKGQKIWGTRQKSSLFPYKRTAFFSGTPNFFGPSYFEVALEQFFLTDGQNNFGNKIPYLSDFQTVPQKLGIILQNKVYQKSKLSTYQNKTVS